ncbi:MAG: hypothetical protein ABH845_03010 [Candidatus Omnitrophota bacterium]
MAKIKSSIELAMEKTMNFRLSREEKEMLQEEEIHSRAMGLVNRFLDMDLHFREVQKELAKYESDQRAQIERIMFRYLREAIHVDRDNSLILEGIEKLRPESRSLTASIQDLVKSYQAQRDRELEKISGHLRTRLEKTGISGSAVVPKVMGSPEWETALASFKPPFEKRLQDFLSKLDG